MAVPGTDLRSIPNSSPIPPLLDMAAVEATGGEASEEGMESEVPPEMQAEIMSLVEQIGPDIAIKALQGLASQQEQEPDPMAPPMGGAAPAGPMGALMGMGQ